MRSRVTMVNGRYGRPGVMGRIAHGGFVVLLIATLPSSGVLAADIAPPFHADGERFVLRMADARVGDCIAEPDSAYRFTLRCEAGQPRTEDLRPYLHLPVRIGKSWTHHFREVIGGSPMSVQVVVTARETVTVPAGTYEAYRLEIDERRPDAEEGARQTCWYAPAIGFPVKCEGSIGHRSSSWSTGNDADDARVMQ